MVTIDLDYFAELSPNEQSVEFERVWKLVVGLRNLRAVTIAISRPYLADDQEADRLVRLALAAALSLPTARIQFEPFRVVGHDESLRACEFRAQGRAVPAFDLAKSSEATRALLLANRSRIAVRTEAARWEQMLQSWRAEAPEFHVAIKDHPPSTDNIWRVSATDPAQLEVLAEPWGAKFERVQWIVELPESLRCNLLGASDEKMSFARGAPPRPRWREVALASTDATLPISEIAPFFDQATGSG
ncbi:MAG: hypothetical protein M3Y03_05580, partial [Verrucomicrobiota bacterium]|nr:hypothetical protein [Verrucomicrobiota bacterium]